MITFEEACEIAKKSFKANIISPILEIEESWLFFDELAETQPIGYCPLAVNKKAGTTSLFHIPTNLNDYSNAIELDIPDGFK